MKNESKFQMELKIYKRYRTLLPMTDSELQKYQTSERIQNVLNKGYAEILFGKDGEDDWKGKITKIVVSDSIPAESVIRSSGTAVYGDISKAGDGSVIGWVEKQEDAAFKYDVKKNEQEYILHICGDGKVCAPMDCSGLFDGYFSVKTMEFGNVFDTSQVTDMRNMFYGCKSLEKLDMSGFCTWNVKDMSGMFFVCPKLKKLDVSGFDTRNVTDMGSMFRCCSSLKKLDVSGFDTRNVTNMNTMFLGCSNLKTLDVSRFNTENVTSMDGMFAKCEKLKKPDISHFNLKNAGNVEGMFAECWTTSFEINAAQKRIVSKKKMEYESKKKMEYEPS